MTLGGSGNLDYKGGWRKHKADLSFIPCMAGNSG